MVKRTLDDWNKIIKSESDITPEFEKEFPYFAEAYRNGFKLKRFFRKAAYPLYFLFLYLSSLGTIFFIILSIMLFFPLIFLFGDFGILSIGYSLISFSSIIGRSIDFKLVMDFILIIALIYSLLNELVKYILKKIFKLEFKIKIYVEMLFFLGIYVVLTIISFIVALIVSNSNILTILWYYIIMFFIGLIFLSYKLLMLMIAKYLKQFIYSE